MSKIYTLFSLWNPQNNIRWVLSDPPDAFFSYTTTVAMTQKMTRHTTVSTEQTPEVT